MKSMITVDRIEAELPEKPRACRYCSGEPALYLRADKNFSGTRQWYTATMRCQECGASVMAFGIDRRSAAVMCRSYWERGVLDAE